MLGRPSQLHRLWCSLLSSYAEMEADSIFLSCSLSLLSQSALMTMLLATGECHQVSLKLSYWICRAFGLSNFLKHKYSVTPRCPPLKKARQEEGQSEGH